MENQKRTMTAGRLIEQYRPLLLEREVIESMIEHLNSTLYSPRAATLSDMPHGSTAENDRREAMMDKKLDLLRRYTEKSADILDMLLEIEDMLNVLRNPAERSVLRMRYLLGRSQEETASFMGYSDRQIRNIQDAAIEHLNSATKEKIQNIS